MRVPVYDIFSKCFQIVRYTILRARVVLIHSKIDYTIVLFKIVCNFKMCTYINKDMKFVF